MNKNRLRADFILCGWLAKTAITGMALNTQLGLMMKFKLNTYFNFSEADGPVLARFLCLSLTFSF